VASAADKFYSLAAWTTDTARFLSPWLPYRNRTRKGDGEPGVKAIWKGLTKIRLVAEALREMSSAYS